MIRISKPLIDLIRGHAARTYPHECCGALLGRDEGDHRSVLDLVSLDNQREGEAARRRFLVTAEDYRLTEETARARNLELIGFYHSHPDHPARPSDYDRDHALPWFSYLIVSVEQGTPRQETSWLLAEDHSRFDEEPIVETDGPAPIASP